MMRHIAGPLVELMDELTKYLTPTSTRCPVCEQKQLRQAGELLECGAYGTTMPELTLMTYHDTRLRAARRRLGVSA